MKLKAELAQEIVNSMMKQIPYNINMMNEDGVIIASGDKSRIGQAHLGANQVIKMKKTLPMVSEHGDHGQPGVNMPINYKDEIIGVVGITGSPERVVPLASLLKVATELLVEQSELQSKEDQKKTKLNRFLFRWIQPNNDPATIKNLKLEAEQLHIDLSLSRYVVDMKTSLAQARKIKLHFSDFLLNRADNTQIIITDSDETIAKIIEIADSKGIKIGISDKQQNIAKAFRQAQITVNLAAQLGIKDQRYSDIYFINEIKNSNLAMNHVVEKLKNISRMDQGSEYLQSLFVYVRKNQVINKAASELHIHRNTLTYRLEKIRTWTNLDPWNTENLMQLYVGLIKLITK